MIHHHMLLELSTDKWDCCAHKTFNISTARGGGGTFQPLYRKKVWNSIDFRFNLKVKFIWHWIDPRLNWFELPLIWSYIIYMYIHIIEKGETTLLYASKNLWSRVGSEMSQLLIRLITYLRNVFFARLLSKMQVGNQETGAFLQGFLQKWNIQTQKQSFSAKNPSNMQLRNSKHSKRMLCETAFQKLETLKLKHNSKTQFFGYSILPSNMKHQWSFFFFARLASKMELHSNSNHFLYETSYIYFKNGTCKLKNEAFLRDVLQKLKFPSSNIKFFCETSLSSFKNGASKLKNKTFLRDFLQKWNFQAQKRSFSVRLLSKMKLRTSKTKNCSETSIKK